MTVLLFVVGLVLLIVGAEFLVRGASGLAIRFNVSPLIIGLTVVAFGTSSPELAVSFKAALSDQANIALGNVIGSNIFNILFILGLSALITPLVVSRQLIRFDVPIMILLSFLVLVLGLDGVIGRYDGMILVTGLVFYITFLFKQSKQEKKFIKDEYANEFGREEEYAKTWWANTLLVFIGLAMLVLGSHWLVNSSVVIALYLGVSDLIIGLTIIAAGTSLPEVVTSIIASIKGERDIAVGNVVGSNIFNIMGVLGLSSMVATSGIKVPDGVIHFDLPVMIVVALACLPIFFTGGIISRKEGALLFVYYLAYTLYLMLAAMHHDALIEYRVVMLYFVIPITMFTLFVVSLNEIRKKKQTSL